MDLFDSEGKYGKVKQSAFAAVLCCILIPVFVVALYNRPVADDYNYSIKVYQEIQQNGVSLWGVLSSAMEMNIDFYNGWQGLYSSAFLLALQPGVFGEQFYAVTTFLMVGMIYGAFFLACKWLLKELVPTARYSVPLLALFITFFIVQDMPSPLEGVYWYNGAMNYMPFCLLTLLNILLVCKIHLTDCKKWQYCYLGISMVLSFVISGGNHVTSFLNLLAMLGLGLLSCVRKQYKVCASFACAAAGFYLMLSAPGTARRTYDLAEISGEVSKVYAVAMGLLQSVGMSIEWFNRGMVCFLLLLTPLLWRVARENRFALRFRWPLLPVAMSILIMGAMWCIPFYAYLSFGSGRLYNVVWVTYLVLVVGCYTYLLGWVRYCVAPKLTLPEAFAQRKLLGVCAGCVCIGVILVSGNAYPQLETYTMVPSTSLVACFDLLSGRAQGYAAQTDARIALYTDPDVDEVLVEPLDDYPSLLFFSDLGETPDVWPSIAISAYYDKPISLLPDETLDEVQDDVVENESVS